MATATARGANKTAFIKDYLAKNPTASPTRVMEAWKESGRNGSISSTLVSNVRKELGLAGNARVGRAARSADGPAAAPERAGTARKAAGAGKTKGPKGTRRGAQGKSQFIKELLVDNPQATYRVVNEAWSDAGMEGTISETLVSRVRSGLGLAGNVPKGRAPGATTKAATTAAARAKAERPEPRPRQGDRDRLLTEVEGDLDRLIFKLMDVGGLDRIEEELRRVRRQVVRSHQS
jgi:hypothetical protein